MPRFAQIRQAFISLVVLGVAFGVYSLCVVPFVEPNGRDDDVSATTETQFADASRSTDRFVRELSPLFPKGSWELNQPKVLHTDQATILLQEFEQLQDGSLHVKPCTLVFFGDKPDKDDTGPTIMQAPEGAILAFDEPLDISSGSFGKPVAGRLVGPIRIFRAGGENADDLELVTSNVEISNSRVWTREQVSFRLGNTYGSGSELQLTRSESDEKEPNEDSRELLDDLGSIELQRLDRLSFRVEQNDLFESLSRPGTLSQAPNNNASLTPDQVEVRSDGPMHFDLKLMIATIEDNVTISRQENGQKPDTLRASRLSLHFARNKKTKAVTNPQSGKKESSIELTRLIADGNPLVIDAKSKSAYVESKHLEYDFGTRQIELRGGLIDYEGPIPGQPKQQKSVQVKLRGPTYQIVAPSVAFENSTDPTQWSMLAAGAGQFVGSPDGRGQMQASWSRGMRMTPAQGRQVLRIDGNASVQAPGIGSIGATAIELWLRQESKQIGTRLDGTPVFEKKPVPERLITESLGGEKTQIDSPQFRGTLEKMEIRFEPDPHPVRATTSTRGFGQRSNQPSQRLTQVPLADDKSKPTYRIDGGELTAWVDPKTQDVRRMIVRGQSRIVEDSPSQRPFELQGTAIDLTLVDGVPVATISGTPAVMRSPELDVVGNTIEFDGAGNDIKIPGAGTLKVQATGDLWGQNTKQPSNLNGPAQPKKATPIDIEWQRGLHFDGEVVSVSGNVQATGEDLKFSANEVSITLDRIVDLSNLNSGKVRPELKFLSARGRVEAAVGSRNELGVVESFQRVAARNLDVDFTTGEVEASGPGRLSFTSKEQMLPAIGGVPQQAPPRGVANNAPSASELSHLSIAFNTKIKGNLQRREAQLFDNIRMWFGPVANWEDVADPQQRGQLREKDVWISCSELFVLESPSATPGPNRKPIELLARGDAYVEGQLYAAKGHQIKYAEDKGMMTFEGDSRRPAELWQRKSVGDQATSSGRVRRIRYWRDTEQFELDGLIGIDVSAAPSDDVK